MGKARQTVERRQLGLALRRLREQSGRSQLQVGKYIGVSDSRISKVEDGTATLDPTELDKLLDLYAVAREERATVLALGAEARKRQRRGTPSQPGTYTDALPDSFQRLADMEAASRTLYCYEPGLIPGLLQSPRYMRAILRTGDGVWWPKYGHDLESRMAFRCQRQERVLGDADSRELKFVFTENALVDDERFAEVMREQLEHLLVLDERHPNLTIQVLRLGALDNPAPSGGIVVLDFDGTAPRVGFTPVVYGPSTYFTDEKDTTALLRAFTRLTEKAMSPAESRELIQRLVAEIDVS
ncbi:helix-turn-helix domain-containing protein [Goodfellowiella coeruleoviolacea]|uniref:Helix-turn-helix domain-containing protein n=1 Tax=Goodfellowiella coeruleoviolacea TaxID=334858 RepID=A0AAE3GAV5_9PSEU|nr:helix-turn-helix transcriptional regulator [Goodfellowiella coeruleoviolacea]MCP2164740.1 Helix-turn-helix domain-containing protein [Goodfellowiella coeruleoviolacea]